jgi:hypothetical protein
LRPGFPGEHVEAGLEDELDFVDDREIETRSARSMVVSLPPPAGLERSTSKCVRSGERTSEMGWRPV